MDIFGYFLGCGGVTAGCPEGAASAEQAEGWRVGAERPAVEIS